MNDREKVIERLEECLSASCRGFRTCPYSDDAWDAVASALALLREQEPIVRCGDCKYWYACKCWNDNVFQQVRYRGHRSDFVTDSDWFCAEGERK